MMPGSSGRNTGPDPPGPRTPPAPTHPGPAHDPLRTCAMYDSLWPSRDALPWAQVTCNRARGHLTGPAHPHLDPHSPLRSRTASREPPVVRQGQEARSPQHPACPASHARQQTQSWQDAACVLHCTCTCTCAAIRAWTLEDMREGVNVF